MLAYPPRTDNAVRHRLIHGIFVPSGPYIRYPTIIIAGPDPVGNYRLHPGTFHQPTKPSWLRQVHDHKQSLEGLKIGDLIRARKANEAKDLLEADSAEYPELAGQYAETIADFYLEQQDGREALKVLAPLISKREPRILCRVSLALSLLNTIYPGQLQYVDSQIREIDRARTANALPMESTPDNVMLMSCLGILAAGRGRDLGRGSFLVGGASRDATWFFNGLAWKLDEGNPLTAISFLRLLWRDRYFAMAFHVCALARLRAKGLLKVDLDRITPWLFRFGPPAHG